MSITTYSQFFYGHTITESNYYLDFNEGSGELTAELNSGSYSLEDFATEVARAMKKEDDTSYAKNETKYKHCHCGCKPPLF